MIRAAVLGKPIAHSLSPVIHRAGYAALGLTDWSFDAIECDEAGFPELTPTLGPQWAGLCLTMPLKLVGARSAATCSDLVTTLGVANTWVREAAGWRAENTDAPGFTDALSAVGVTSADRVAILGGGGTARAALAAVAAWGGQATAYARRSSALDELREIAARLGVAFSGAPWSEAASAANADLVISTVPQGGADTLAELIRWQPGAVFFDAIYAGWPTPLAQAAAAGGATVLSGLELLFAQAVRQFALFTGLPAPITPMRAALEQATGHKLAPALPSA